MLPSNWSVFVCFRQKKFTALHWIGASEPSSCWQVDPDSTSNNMAGLSPLLHLKTTEIKMNAPLATLEDKTLIRLTLAGHAECFGVLMDRHLGAVKKRISAMVRNPADADDLSQEVSLKVWRHLAQYRSEASFRTWMTRVAINETFQSLRREKRRRRGSTDPACNGGVQARLCGSSVRQRRSCRSTRAPCTRATTD